MLCNINNGAVFHLCDSHAEHFIVKNFFLYTVRILILAEFIF